MKYFIPYLYLWKESLALTQSGIRDKKKSEWSRKYWNEVKSVYFQGNGLEFEMSFKFHLFHQTKWVSIHTFPHSTQFNICNRIPWRICNAKYFQFQFMTWRSSVSVQLMFLPRFSIRIQYTYSLVATLSIQYARSRFRFRRSLHSSTP